MDRPVVQMDFACQGPAEERNGEKWSRVLQPHFGSRAAGNCSYLMEPAAHPAHVVDFIVAAVYSLLDWRGSSWFIWLIWFVLFIWLASSNQKTRQTK
jgi:hypothetical protein